jgi:hypothetical protein
MSAFYAPFALICLVLVVKLVERISYFIEEGR